jgi:sulfite dehydrogenase (quinone) subunit SoeC
MNPALSVILFTTLSGTGYGLWLWLGLRIAFGPRAWDFEPIGWFFALLLGAVLTTIGIVASLWHLGKPMRVWRAFSQWRTSWMSREGVMAIATLVVAALMVAPLPVPHELAMRPLAALLALCALGTICSTAMIYASLKPIPAWRHPLVLPGYVGFALLTGGLAFVAMPQPLPVLRIALPILVALAIAMAILKLIYWRAIDAEPLPQTRGDAIGLPNRKPSVFERPHTEANYLTKEMGFVVARKHAKKLRLLSLVLFAIAPVVLVLIAIATSHPQPWLAIATLCAVAGAFVERWLFFAQAKHLVMLYY